MESAQDSKTNRSNQSDQQVLMLKPAEISRDYNICTATVYRLIERGELPHVKFGAAIRVPAEAMRAFVESQLDRQDQAA